MLPRPVKWWRVPRLGAGGCMTHDGRWHVRGPIMGQPVFWVYCDGQRYTPTGKYDDAVHFSSAAEAKRFVVRLLDPKAGDGRGDRCELCGRRALPRPRAGKLRYRHKCPHGRWCVRGDRLLGWNANHPTCKECAQEARQTPNQEAV